MGDFRGRVSRCRAPESAPNPWPRAQAGNWFGSADKLTLRLETLGSESACCERSLQSCNDRDCREGPIGNVPRGVIEMPNTVSKFAAWLGTVIVVLRGIPLVAHSAAHVQLAIFLPSVAANAYVVVVLFVLP